MIEIGAKATGANLFLQIAVGRGQDAHVDAQRALGIDALDLACLQGAQQQAAPSAGARPAHPGNSVPPSAASNFPARLSTAPVKAPRTWPNSSLSAMVSGSAAQLT